MESGGDLSDDGNRSVRPVVCSPALHPPEVLSVRGPEADRKLAGCLGLRAALFHFAAGAALLEPACEARAEVDVLGSYKLVEILRDAKDLGNVRFTSVNTFGSVLEGVGRSHSSCCTLSAPGAMAYFSPATFSV